MLLTDLQLLELFYFVQLTREIEERLAILYRQNKVVGGLYRSLGQEGESVASAYALEGRDVTASLIRNLGALVARGADEAGKKWVPVARRGSELRVELGGDEPGVIRQLDHLDQPVAREA